MVVVYRYFVGQPSVNDFVVWDGIESNILPSITSLFDIGSPTLKWASIYADLLDITRIRNDTAIIIDTPVVEPSVDLGTNLGRADKRFEVMHSNNAILTDTMNAAIVETDHLKFVTPIEVDTPALVPLTDLVTSLGTATKRYTDVYSNNIHVNNTFGSTVMETSVIRNTGAKILYDALELEPTIDAYASLGTTNQRFDTLYIRTLSNTAGVSPSITFNTPSLLPYPGQTVNMGSGPYPFNSIVALSSFITTINTTTINANGLITTTSDVECRDMDATRNITGKKLTVQEDILTTGTSSSVGSLAQPFAQGYITTLDGTTLNATTMNSTFLNAGVSDIGTVTCGSITSSGDITTLLDISCNNVTATTDVLARDLIATRNIEGKNITIGEDIISNGISPAVGSLTQPFTSGYITNVYTNFIIPTGTTPALGSMNEVFDSTWSTNVYTNNLSSTAGSTIYILRDMLPEPTNDIRLGTSTRRYLQTHSQSVWTEELHADTTIAPITIYNDLHPQADGTLDIGTSATKFDNVYTQTTHCDTIVPSNGTVSITGDLVPTNDQTHILGSNGKRWLQVTAENYRIVKSANFANVAAAQTHIENFRSAATGGLHNLEDLITAICQVIAFEH